MTADPLPFPADGYKNIIIAVQNLANSLGYQLHIPLSYVIQFDSFLLETGHDSR